MELISAEERRRYIKSFAREAVRLELGDTYATSELERAKFASRTAGEPDDGEWLEPSCSQVRAGVAEGRSYRRACVAPEPLSEYQQWGHSVRAVLTAAGEDIRMVPRRLLSTVALPGNDFWMFDEKPWSSGSSTVLTVSLSGSSTQSQTW